MRALWLLLLLLPAPLLRAELQLWLVGGATVDQEIWTPVPGLQPKKLPDGSTLDLNEIVGVIKENSLLDLRFELRNTATNQGVEIPNLELRDFVGKGAFSPFWGERPRQIGSGAKYTFEVRFHPPGPQEYMSGILVGNHSYLLRGSASTRTVMCVKNDFDGCDQIINGNTYDFGKVNLGQSKWKSFQITNLPGGQALTPPVLNGENAAWFLRNAPESNRTVPETGVYEFDVEFRPNRSGLVNTSLTVDGRTITLVGEGMVAAAPNFNLLPSAIDLDSDSEAEARIELLSPAAQAVSGTLTLVFERDAGEMPDDTVIQFIESGSRSIGFTVPAGATVARFGEHGGEAARFKTGTSSGKIRLVATLGQWEKDKQLSIRSDAPKLVSGSIERQPGSLAVAVSGFDNTRSATRAIFHFFDRNGQPIGDASGVEAAVSDIFSGFFRTSSNGGVFAMRAVFPIQGDVNAIGRVDVQLRNKLGVSQTFAAR